ncbi:MAG: dihydroorotate dehydrogenase (quinone), partial [Cyanobacteriota bacterium]|nr:dihydroorotate dehydrogenase (quinone) [Cyanobacteriota bacterium]
ADQLGDIIAALQGENLSPKPLLVKISPDLDWPAIDAILDLALARGLAGIIATNTTLDRQGLTTPSLTTGNPPSAEAGGLSGAPLTQRATEVIRYIYGHTQGQLPIIGVGGVFTAEDAWRKITAGATLVQTYTGWVYEGPWMVRRVLQGLLTQLEHHQLGSIGEAVGLDHRR